MLAHRIALQIFACKQPQNGEFRDLIGNENDERGRQAPQHQGFERHAAGP